MTIQVKGDGSYLDVNQAPFICPVTTMPMNGIQSFVVNWKCGCVFSEKALHEVALFFSDQASQGRFQVQSDNCHGCGGPLNKEDIVVLYPSDELLEQYKVVF